MCHGVTPHARAGLFSAANLLQGRVDVWCRCVTAGLYLSDDVRRDTVVHLVMQSDDLASCRLVSVDGARVEGLAPAEKNVALLLQRAMQHASLDQLPTLARDAPGGRRSRGGDGTASEAGDGDEVREKSARNARKRVGEWLAKRPGSAGPVPGIAVSDHQSLEACLRDALRGCGAVALLDVDGDDASGCLARPLDNPENGEGFAVVVGDGSGITPDERRTLMFVFGAVLMAMGGKTLLASHCVVLAHAALDGEGFAPFGEVIEAVYFLRAGERVDRDLLASHQVGNRHQILLGRHAPGGILGRVEKNGLGLRIVSQEPFNRGHFGPETVGLLQRGQHRASTAALCDDSAEVLDAPACPEPPTADDVVRDEARDR